MSLSDELLLYTKTLNYNCLERDVTRMKTHIYVTVVVCKFVSFIKVYLWYFLPETVFFFLWVTCKIRHKVGPERPLMLHQCSCKLHTTYDVSFVCRMCAFYLSSILCLKMQICKTWVSIKPFNQAWVTVPFPLSLKSFWFFEPFAYISMFCLWVCAVFKRLTK